MQEVVGSTITRTIRVLVVDDHPLLREGLVAVLGTHPAFVVVGAVGSARAAIADVARLEPDVVVVDLKLDDGDGADVCAWVQAEYPRVRLLVFTRWTADRIVMKAFRSGAHGYVVKTTDPTGFLAAIRSVAEGGTYVDPTIADGVIKTITAGRRDNGSHGLTTQELRVMELVGQGMTNRAAADHLGLSVDTVKTHVRHAMRKLQARDRRSAARILAGSDPD